jgi:hypothetical protein
VSNNLSVKLLRKPCKHCMLLLLWLLRLRSPVLLPLSVLMQLLLLVLLLWLLQANPPRKVKHSSKSGGLLVTVW